MLMEFGGADVIFFLGPNVCWCCSEAFCLNPPRLTSDVPLRSVGGTTSFRADSGVMVSFADGCFPRLQPVIFYLSVNVSAALKDGLSLFFFCFHLLFFSFLISKRERKMSNCNLIFFAKEEQCKNPFVWQEKMPHYLILLGMIVL